MTAQEKCNELRSILETQLLPLIITISYLICLIMLTSEIF